MQPLPIGIFIVLVVVDQVPAGPAAGAPARVGELVRALAGAMTRP